MIHGGGEILQSYYYNSDFVFLKYKNYLLKKVVMILTVKVYYAYQRYISREEGGRHPEFLSFLQTDV